MKQLPSIIVVCGHSYAVRTYEARCEGTDNAGEVRHGTQEIAIDGFLHEEQMTSTLLHEALEVINQAHDLELSHSVICTLETALYELLTQNEPWWRA